MPKKKTDDRAEAKAEKPEPEAPPATAAPSVPTSAEVRRAKKAQLVAWCEALGLETEGKVDDLRKRLLEQLEARAEAEAAKEAESATAEMEIPTKPEEAPAGPKEAAEEVAEEEVEEAHAARLKPKLDPETRALLELRAAKSSSRPRFRRQEWFRYRRLGEKWRAPKGGQSKLRRHFGYRWNVPSVGYRGPRKVRGLHSSGFQEVLVHTPREVEGVDPERQAVRIGRGVGTRKRELIEKACEERGIRVLNRMVTA